MSPSEGRPTRPRRGLERRGQRRVTSDPAASSTSRPRVARTVPAPAAPPIAAPFAAPLAAADDAADHGADAGACANLGGIFALGRFAFEAHDCSCETGSRCSSIVTSVNRNARCERPLHASRPFDLRHVAVEDRAGGKHGEAVDDDGAPQSGGHRRFDLCRLRRQSVVNSSGSSVPAGAVTSRKRGFGGAAGRELSVRRALADGAAGCPAGHAGTGWGCVRREDGAGGSLPGSAAGCVPPFLASNWRYFRHFLRNQLPDVELRSATAIQWVFMMSILWRVGVQGSGRPNAESGWAVLGRQDRQSADRIEVQPTVRAPRR